MSIKMRRTQRGFAKGQFVDRYGAQCSIQKSSLADEAAIWIGVDDPQPKVLVPGKGFQPVDLKVLVQGELSIHTRMHLTVDMVRQLLPLLQHFADTGELPEATTSEPVE